MAAKKARILFRQPLSEEPLEKMLAFAIEEMTLKIQAAAIILRQEPEEKRRNYVNALMETLREKHADDKYALSIDQRLQIALEKLLGLNTESQQTAPSI